MVDFKEFMVQKLFDKKPAAGSGFKNEIKHNEQLAEELLNKIIRQFFEKVHSSFRDNIRTAGLVSNWIISKFNKGSCFLRCAIDICNKYTQVIPLKDNESITITNAFQKALDQSKRKPNKIWVDKGSELCNRSIKFWLKDNGKKCIQHIMKEYFLLKDLLRLEKMTFTNT